MRSLIIPAYVPTQGLEAPGWSEKGLRTASFFAANLLLFLLVLQTTTRKQDVFAYLKVMANVSAIYALYGLAAYFAGGEYVLWFKKPDNNDIALSSTFMNRNNYATFVGLGLLCGATITIDSLLTRARGRRPGESHLRRLITYPGGNIWIYVLGLILMTTAAILTASRAGVLAISLGVGTLVLLSLPRLRPSVRLGILTGLAASLLVLISISGDLLLDRLSLENGSGVRLIIYDLILGNWASNPLSGVGLAQFDSLFSVYRAENIAQPILRAHNDYLEFAYTAGTIALFFLLVPPILLTRIYYRRLSDGSGPYPQFTLGIASSVLVGVHSSLDFPLQIPAVGFYYAIIQAMVYSLTRPVSK
ncbi:O-antigen ligase family protein [Kordiimonas sp.]|uniref:O-antigen ligase family protein n=1 Tax=Kordiimonas sp. TaxID=1970157 RepID=UPI003A8EF114